MKIKSLNLLLLLSIFTVSSYAQNMGKFTKDDVFFDQPAFMREFQEDADKVYESKNFLSVDYAKTQLEGVDGKKIKIKKVKPNTKTLTPNEVYNKLTKSAVAFGISYNCGQCDATHVGVSTGYVIDESGLIVTNYHVVESFLNKSIENFAMIVKLIDGKSYPVMEVLTSSKQHDLAVVRVDTKGDKLTPIPFGDNAKPGEDVFLLSNPFNMMFYFSTGKVARNHMYATPLRISSAIPEMEITADYAVGSSGGAIVDNKANLVGTVAVTRSIYANPQEKKEQQMVIKGTIPVISLKKLIEF